MSLALKCDFCKSFFTFKDKTFPNIVTFGQICESEDGIKSNIRYNIAPDAITKNAYNIIRGVYTFNVCNKCMKRIIDLIIEDEEGGRR